MIDHADRFVADVERERLARQEDRREAEAFQAKIDAERELNDLASDVAKMSRAAGSPINAYHARADIDELLRQGTPKDELRSVYERFYGLR